MALDRLSSEMPDTPGFYWYYDPAGKTMRLPGGEVPEIVEFDGDSFFHDGQMVGTEQVESGYFCGPLTIPDWKEIRLQHDEGR